ncbi:MAG TPA: ferredoxin reductase family protein [Kineosporiaceae bacterium]
MPDVLGDNQQDAARGAEGRRRGSMTTTTAARGTRRPDRALQARVVVLAAVAVNLVIVELLFAAHGAGQNQVLTVANFAGLHAALIMMGQLLLVARLPWLDRRIGMDRLTAWHRWTGFTLFWAVLAHASLVVAGFAVLDSASPLRTFASLLGVPASLLGMIAATLLAAVAVTSIRLARRRASYEAWHALHLVAYLAVLAALVHQWLEGTTFTASPLGVAYWAALWTFTLVALVSGRLVIPLRRNALHQLRVAAVVPESDNVVSIHVTGQHLDRLRARAGQFFIWRFPGHNPWWQANPFSLSAAPDGTSLRLTVKATGTTSAGLRHLEPGTRVFAEGPYGAFTHHRRTRDALLLIAGGVGITPIRALLEEATGPVVVLYRVRTEDDAVLLPELNALAAAKGAQLHLLTGRTGTGTPPRQPLDPAPLRALVPDIHDRDVFVCGPPAMTRAVLRSLRSLKVPSRQVHSERFGFAG